MNTTYTNVLEIKNLSKSLGRRQIIKDISFTVKPGEILGFLGPNGAGKTTTIKMIVGLLGVDAGTIEICGHDISKNFEKAMANIGAIVENPEFYHDLSGLANLKMILRLTDVPNKKERLHEMIELAGLQNRINDKVKKYSLGMRQRLGIAIALLNKPKILILDEPTNGLDPAGIKDLRLLLKKLAHEQGMSILVSSHQLAEMQLMVDRVQIIDSGKLLNSCNVAELLSLANADSGYNLQFAGLDFCAKAIDLLTPTYGDLVARIDDYTIILRVGETDIPQIVKQLAVADYPITGLFQSVATLEDAFLSITEGDKQIA